QIHYAADKIQRGIQGVAGEGEGGGERKGKEGIAAGIEGMLGRGGSVALGTRGNEGKAGMVGSGGSAPGLGIVGMVGCGVLRINGNGGSVAVGKGKKWVFQGVEEGEGGRERMELRELQLGLLGLKACLAEEAVWPLV
ncbi:hypothetical protein Gogos_000455, partial [Gossypium gossypioides]|nr:hypothetical protein [Gossypium gossypioides]